MIPTGIGITFLVFFILQVAPDGPFERAVRQIKQANMGAGESGIGSAILAKKEGYNVLVSEITGISKEVKHIFNKK